MSAVYARADLLALYTSAALWNISMGMFQVVLPLYALSLGFTVLKIGTIVALPVLAEAISRFVGGAMSDRFGEARILQVCYLLLALAGASLLAAESYSQLLGAQLLANLSRSTFWTSVQSLGSQLPGASMGRKLGLLIAVNYGAGMIGLNLGGILVGLFGYGNASLVLTVVAASCSLLGLALPKAEPKPEGRTVWQITRGMARFLRYPQTWLIISVSYAAALPVSMTLSIYPVYLAHLAYTEEWIGVTLSLRSLGPVLIGTTLSSIITVQNQRTIYALGMVALGLFLIGSGLAEKIVLLGFFIIALGAAGGMMDLLYQMQAAVLSQASDRSVAMASMGLGWNFAPFFTPLIVGWLAETQGFRLAFLVTGFFFVLIALGTRLWHQLLARDGLAHL